MPAGNLPSRTADRNASSSDARNRRAARSRSACRSRPPILAQLSAAILDRIAGPITSYRRSHDSDHDPRPTRHRQPCRRVREGHGTPGHRFGQRTRPCRLRRRIARARPGPRVPAQRLRLLRRHAHQGCPRGGRERATIAAVAVWEESPFFTARERAAFAFTEQVTRVADTHVPDSAYARRRRALQPRRSRRAARPHRDDQRVECVVGRITGLGTATRLGRLGQRSAKMQNGWPAGSPST